MERICLIWNKYLAGELYSKDTMLYIMIAIAFIGFVILFANMVHQDNKHNSGFDF
jgi:hypothetical protein